MHHARTVAIRSFTGGDPARTLPSDPVAAAPHNGPGFLAELWQAIAAQGIAGNGALSALAQQPSAAPATL
ncbi:hypothetical protein [Mycobacterium sp.]|uniref:hypothetical protein n=1 Tax=Mycobacterium sp. TaxID=1785 RepID=UPI00345BA9DD